MQRSLTALHVLYAQPAADAVIEEGRQYRPVADALEGIVGRRAEQLGAWASPSAGVLPSLLLGYRPLYALDRIAGDRVRSQR